MVLIFYVALVISFFKSEGKTNDSTIALLKIINFSLYCDPIY